MPRSRALSGGGQRKHRPRRPFAGPHDRNRQRSFQPPSRLYQIPGGHGCERYAMHLVVAFVLISLTASLHFYYGSLVVWCSEHATQSCCGWTFHLACDQLLFHLRTSHWNPRPSAFTERRSHDWSLDQPDSWLQNRWLEHPGRLDQTVILLA